MTKLYLYKMTVDAGGAPCVSDGILSLAICKPAIRSSARQGDIVLGFAANSLYRDNSLIYTARVTSQLDGREYFSKSKYAARPDCVYDWDGRHFEWKVGAKYHSRNDLEHDLGKPPNYNRANVLLSKGTQNFRYFGSKCPIRYKRDFPHIKKLIENLGRGHRVNHGPEVRQELQRFMEQLWHVPSVYRETVAPKTWCSKKCGDKDGEIVTVECRRQSRRGLTLRD
jgi:hypothetical protein